MMALDTKDDEAGRHAERCLGHRRRRAVQWFAAAAVIAVLGATMTIGLAVANAETETGDVPGGSPVDASDPGRPAAPDMSTAGLAPGAGGPGAKADRVGRVDTAPMSTVSAQMNTTATARTGTGKQTAKDRAEPDNELDDGSNTHTESDDVTDTRGIEPSDKKVTEPVGRVEAAEPADPADASAARVVVAPATFAVAEVGDVEPVYSLRRAVATAARPASFAAPLAAAAPFPTPSAPLASRAADPITALIYGALRFLGVTPFVAPGPTALPPPPLMEGLWFGLRQLRPSFFNVPSTVGNSPATVPDYTVIATVPVTQPGQTGGLAVSSAQDRVYVTDHFFGNVSFLDTTTNAVAGTFFVGDNAAAVAVSPSGDRLYVTHDQDGTVSVIDTASDNVVATIQVGGLPLALAVSPNGGRVYVTNQSDGTVSVIDTTNNTVADTIHLGGGPDAVAVSPNGDWVYVADGGGDTVWVVKTATNTVAASVKVGNAPAGVAVSPHGDRVYVTNGLGDTVSVIDTATNTVAETITVGNGPAGVAVSPDGRWVYITKPFAGHVLVIDAATNTVVATVTVGAGPQTVAVNRTGDRIYVEDHFAGTVSVLAVAHGALAGLLAA